MRIQLQRHATDHPEQLAELAVRLLEAAEAVERCVDTLEAGKIAMATPELLELHRMNASLLSAASSLEHPLFYAMHRDAGELFNLAALEQAEAALEAIQEDSEVGNEQ